VTRYDVASLIHSALLGGSYKDHPQASRQLAYNIASAALGHDSARGVADAWGAIDGLTLAGLAMTGKHAWARRGVVAYIGVLHLYMAALVFLSKGGPHATNTETKTKESLYPER